MALDFSCITLQDRERQAFVRNESTGKIRKCVDSVVTNDATNPIPVEIIDGTFSDADTVNTFGSISSLSSGSLTTIVTYTVPVGKKFFLQLVDGSGENIATYDLEVSSTAIARRRTYFGSSLDVVITFAQASKGIEYPAGTVIRLRVEHARTTMSADFDGRILGVEEDV